MSATRTLPAAAPIINGVDTDDARHAAKQGELHRRVLQAIISSDGFTDIPPDSVLWLLPDDDPEHVVWTLRAVTNSAQPGRNVYLRWIRVAELPPLPPDQGPWPVVRSIEYHPDGSIKRVRVPDGDGWREVEPTPEDRAGLPPRG
jgi:hypothetical protein